MAEKLPLAIVGCGGMGHRHLYGLAELQAAGLSPFELVGTCDPNLDNANSLADQAQERLGTRPQPVADLAALAALGEIQAKGAVASGVAEIRRALMERAHRALHEARTAAVAQGCSSFPRTGSSSS